MCKADSFSSESNLYLINIACLVKAQSQTIFIVSPGAAHRNALKDDRYIRVCIPGSHTGFSFRPGSEAHRNCKRTMIHFQSHLILLAFFFCELHAESSKAQPVISQFISYAGILLRLRNFSGSHAFFRIDLHGGFYCAQFLYALHIIRHIAFPDL